MSDARCTSSKRQWSRRSWRQVASVGGTDSGATRRTLRTSPDARIASWTGTWLGAPAGTAHDRRSGARASTAARSRASSTSWGPGCTRGAGRLRTANFRGVTATVATPEAAATGGGATTSAGQKSHNSNAARINAAAARPPRRGLRDRFSGKRRAAGRCPDLSWGGARLRGMRARPRACRDAGCVMAAPSAAVPRNWQTTRAAGILPTRAPGRDRRASRAPAARH